MGAPNKELAAVLNRSTDVVGYTVGEGLKHRIANESFASRMESLNSEIAARLQSWAAPGRA
jgi:hypothetical protein